MGGAPNTMGATGLGGGPPPPPTPPPPCWPRGGAPGVIRGFDIDVAAAAAGLTPDPRVRSEGKRNLSEPVPIEE